MQIASTQNASPLPVPPAAPGPNGQSGEDSPFAKMLSAQKQPAARPEEANAARAEAKPQAKADTSTHTDAKAAEASQTADAESSDAAQAKSQNAIRRGGLHNAPKVAMRGREGHAPKADAHTKAEGADTREQKASRETDKKDAPGEPSAAELAAMNRPVAEPAVAPPVAAGKGGAEVTALPGVSASPGETPIDRPALPADAAAQPMAGAARGPHDTARIDAGDAKRDIKFADVTAEASKAAEAARRTSGEDKIDQQGKLEQMEQRLELPSLREMSGTSHVATAYNAPRVDNVSAPAAVTVAAPVTSPEFSQALGVQVSVLARDGVQHAELHLNPTDMGPISVQIALDGTRAQVDFGADSLATRQIIESGLPELASALRDAGFTLAGGGVSQHARQQQERDGSQQAGSGPRRIAASGDAAPAAVRRATVRMSQGGVDLYA